MDQKPARLNGEKKIMGLSVKRRRKPSQNKAPEFNSPVLSKYWIHDIAAKAMYYPENLEAFKKTRTRLLLERKIIKTSQDE